MTETPTSDPGDLLRRVERLEARCGPVLDVSRIRILGPRGPVMELGTSPDGEPEIVLLDGSGRDRALLRLVENEAVLELLSAEGGPRARVAAGDSAARVVAWSGDGGRRRAEIRALHDGTAVLAVVEGRDAVRSIVGVDAAGDSVLRCEPRRNGEERP